ncbi:hypothetical protein GF318_04725 [Candidatus Micrarchaeota archaeon]|nr:hypothetical protein [Candidatus Micrarchaeota archaeon]
MRGIIVFAALSLLLLGCTGNGEQMTCEEYCKTLPHVQCVGHWNISGTYPECTCQYVCETQEQEEPPENVTEEPEQNETTEPEQNETEEPEQNQTGEPGQNETQEDGDDYEPLAETTNKTIGEMMEDVMEDLRTDFYSENSGSFQMDSFTWRRIQENYSAGDIVFDEAPSSDVEFDGTVIDTIKASGYYVFTETEEDWSEAYGFAIFRDAATMLDTYTGTDAFEVWYFSDLSEYELDNCWIYEKVLQRDEGTGAYISTYYFQCETIEEK